MCRPLSRTLRRTSRPMRMRDHTNYRTQARFQPSLHAAFQLFF